ncbi:hypothetical protein KFL_000100115 [Klebsormidium nitens]|uniref:Uncharacterized protein n=1 Tax=Klebsormidium nitens TaxID=105231 RepID=A0A1Y1HID4_KLENI|nr:hypothetical protein KFL_000100115 [Klebsormidium nitens]|eukprot:GAQ78245.1 hypothetical protein KFL_000100115 [Klebsormidium nitens]
MATKLSQFETLILSKKGGVAELLLNRPLKSNSINGNMWEEIPKAMRLADNMGDVRVIILKGAGRHFCAGIDVSSLAQFMVANKDLGEGREQEKLRRDIKEMQASFTAFEECRKPVIAAVHGACIGAGVDMITACDIRYCTEDARFSVKEVDLAITADIGTLQRLPGIVGEGIARELALTAREFDGQEAKDLKLEHINFAHA